MTEEIRAAILRLHAGGAGYARIVKALEAKGVALSKQTIANVVRGAAAGVTTGAKKPKLEGRNVGGRRARGALPPKDDVPELGDDEDEGDEDDDDAPAIEIDARHLTSLDMIDALIREVDEVHRVIAAKVKRGARNEGSYEKFVNLKLKLAKARAAIEPPKTPDPAEDPANLRARDVVLGFVRDAIRSAEEQRHEMYVGADAWPLSERKDLHVNRRDDHEDHDGADDP